MAGCSLEVRLRNDGSGTRDSRTRSNIKTGKCRQKMDWGKKKGNMAKKKGRMTEELVRNWKNTG